MTTTVGTTHLVISAAKLRAKIEAGRSVVLLEVTRGVDGSAPRGPHLPGAHRVDLTTQLAGAPTAGSGNLPLPDGSSIQADVRRWGIDDGSIVVVYSSGGPALATRAWWVLRWAGVPDVRYLDGGAGAWVAAGGELSDDEVPEADGTFVVTTGSLPTLDADSAATLARTGRLVDARGEAAYIGAEGGGHIPGALSAPSAQNIDADGLLRDDEALRAHYGALGVDGHSEVGVYCGGGVGATLDVFALAKIGIAATLYPGSFSAWTSDPARPVVTGNQPG